jgi:hypothetical protein
MRTVSAILVFCLSMMAGALAVAQGTTDGKDFPGVQALMSEAEFINAGLDALSAEQLKALDAWLVRYTAGDAQVLQTASKEVKEAERDYEVVARLSSGFDGWDGETVFYLDNGQVWRQRLQGKYPYRGPANPEVRISRNFFGFFKMELVDAKRGIGVTRVK